MSPKKAAIIIIVLALLAIAFFAYLFNANKKNTPGNFLPAAEDKIKSEQEIIMEKIAEITANGEQEGKTKDEIREEVVDEINNYIIEAKQNMTQEEKTAEKAKNEARRKIIEEYNNSIKNK